MADGALVHEKTRVEKVNDTYNYYLTFKDLTFGTQVGTVDTLTVDGTAAERTDLGGESHEKVFHFTSSEKLTEKTITFSVSVDGKPLRGHSNVAATLKFNWGNATPLTADQVTSLHKDETTKAQAEKERLEKEAARVQAEKERLEKEKAQKAEADRLEKERLEKEAAAKAESETGEALIQPELPALNINELSKEQNIKEEAEATPQNIFGEAEKTVSQNTSQTVTKGLKQLAKTGLNTTATAGLGVLALLSALVLRRKNNK